MVDLAGVREAAYLEHCRQYAMGTRQAIEIRHGAQKKTRNPLPRSKERSVSRRVSHFRERPSIKLWIDAPWDWSKKSPVDI